MAKSNAGATEITATVDGVVDLNSIETGSELKPGDVVAYVGDDSDVWVEAYLSPSEVEYAAMGQIASFFVDRKKYDGTIVEVFTEGGYINKYPAGKTVVRIAIPKEFKPKIHIGNMVDVRFSKN